MRGKVTLLTPLSASTYLQAYHNLESEESAYYTVLRPFDDVNLVTADALQGTWPEAEWKHNVEQIESIEAASTPRIDTITRSLQTITMDVFLEHLLNPSEDDVRLIAQAELLPEFRLQLKRKLFAEAHSLQPSPYLLRLLTKAFEGDNEVDQSPFNTISARDLRTIVAELQEKGNMTTLNLSNRPEMTEEDLDSILGDHRNGSLKAIILLVTPQISLLFLSAFLGHYEVYHSELLRLPFSNKYKDMYGDYSDPILPLEFSAANSVSQIIGIGLSRKQTIDPKYRLADGHIDWSTLQYTDHGWRSGRLCFSKYPLDIPMPAGKLVHGLARLALWLTSQPILLYDGWGEDYFSRAAACAFATASPRENGKGYGIRPLSTALLLDWEFHQYRERITLKAGRWAVIIVHEALDARDKTSSDEDEKDDAIEGAATTEHVSPLAKTKQFPNLKRLRYALVSPMIGSVPQTYLIADMATYLDHALRDKGESGIAEAKRLSKWWKESTANMDEIEFYSDNDIHEILQIVYHPRQLE